MTWFLGMDTRLRLGRERFERVVSELKSLFWTWARPIRDGNWRPRCYRRSSFGAIGVTSAFFGTDKCAFRKSIWQIVPSKIVIFIHQMASCLYRQLAKCKFPIANGVVSGIITGLIRYNRKSLNFSRFHASLTPFWLFGGWIVLQTTFNEHAQGSTIQNYLG
jgi:hypothetical protein